MLLLFQYKNKIKQYKVNKKVVKSFFVFFKFPDFKFLHDFYIMSD